MKTQKHLFWKIQNGNLMLGDKTVSSIPERFNTPLYLYDAHIALDRYKQIREAFSGFDILYSVKSNPNAFMVRLFANEKAGADVASLQELKVALENGYSPKSITFGGPGKRSSDLNEVVKADVHLIDVESERELKLLEDMGAQYEREIQTTLRVNPMRRLTKAAEIMSGEPTKYGFDEENLTETFEHFSSKHVRINGIHAHVASQVLDSTTLLEHYKSTAELSKKLAAHLGFELNIINFGGGIGVPYSAQESHLDIFSLGLETNTFLSEAFPDARQRPKFQLELGRFLVAECGIFLTKVIEVKHSRGVNFVITDGGISGFSRPAMPWAQQHLCTIVSKQNGPLTGSYKIVGPSCLASDVICENARLPDPKPGDVIAIHNAGAYGYTMSPLLWASQPIPDEIVFFDGEYIVSRISTVLP